MANRNQALQEFLDAAQGSYTLRAREPRAASSLSKIFAALETAAPQSPSIGSRLPICHHLDELTVPSQSLPPDLQRLMETFSAVESSLVWRLREGDWTGASDNFRDSHANAMIVGPGGLEPRSDVWLGVSLIGPNVRYPDHRHTPEETYLVIGPGEFRQGRGPWIHVPAGETFYNPYNIVHSMRSSENPLFAFWALRERT